MRNIFLLLTQAANLKFKNAGISFCTIFSLIFSYLLVRRVFPRSSLPKCSTGTVLIFPKSILHSGSNSMRAFSTVNANREIRILKIYGFFFHTL